MKSKRLYFAVYVFTLFSVYAYLTKMSDVQYVIGTAAIVGGYFAVRYGMRKDDNGTGKP